MPYQESEKLELKTSLSEWKEVVVALSAFANKHGGKVLVGVKPNGEPANLPLGKSSLEDLANKIKQHTDPVLLNIFHRLKIIEGWGSGLQKIYGWCSANGNPMPEFVEMSGAFVVRFLKRVSEGVSEGVKKLLQFIHQNPGQRGPSIAKQIGHPFKTVEHWLKQLRVDGKIVFRGSPKIGGYFVV